MKRKFFYPLFLVLAFVTFTFISCVKQDFDTPPSREIPIGTQITLGELVAMYNGEAFKIDDTMSAYGVVVGDESSGNIYKNSYVQDATGAINLRLKNSGGLYEGDSIRIYLTGLYLSYYNGVTQLDSVDVDLNIVKIKTGIIIEPKVVTIPMLNTYEFTAQLIKLENVEFVASDTAKTWADAIALTTENRTLKDCDGNTVIVRTSGYANFADLSLPKGKGSFIAIVSRFNNDIQLYVRDVSEISLDSARCTGGGGGGGTVTSFNVDFSDQTSNVDILLDGWLNVATVGGRLWRGKDFSGNMYAQATAYNSTDASNECWLVTPGIDLDAMTDPKIEFLSSVAYWTHDGLSVVISSDFDGSNISGATWTELDCALPTQSSTNYEFIESGIISLSSYSGTVNVGFKYVGNGPGGQTASFAVDDIQLYDGQGGGGGGSTLLEEFTTNLGTFTAHSVTGTQVWGWGNFDGGCSKMTGYAGGANNANEDWLVSPAISLVGKTGVSMNFREAINYDTNISNAKVLISTDYDGTSSPASNGTWTEVTGFTRASGSSWTFVDSGDASLTTFEGQTIYIAFKYLSTTSVGSTWEISKVEVKN